jgi:predicted transcriptional regulator
MTKHNRQYLENDALIKAAYMKVLKEQKRMPTLAEAGELCGITSETVRLHLKAIDINDLIEPFRLMGSNVLQGLTEKAEAGDAAAARLFFFLIFDKVERKEIKADIKADIDAKVKADVKVVVSEQTAKLVGDLLARESANTPNKKKKNVKEK